MAQKVNVNVRLDADVKKSMERACAEPGLSMSDASTIFAKKIGRECRVPSDVSADPFYSEENMLRLRKSIAQMENGDGRIHEVDRSDSVSAR